ncbi:deoxynucleoside kinase [Xanthovirga aplysinae]|uniref:deoxynucleoside kinase n=1 Tax=Xanthovirga aplysinae TaxID=2529853 RepID=UPI0012BCEA98|nr:deoxynucleoside kinase [Xanthovirga aplysinae]MTI31276.1 deoxynucleoside kinase [Xanthovirga aplysinae]
MHIAIAGNIGCGKTTLTTKLAEHFGWEAAYESVDDNPYLKDFYGDMERWAFHLQVFFLNNRFNQITEIRKSGIKVVQDRSIYEDAYIFATNLHQSSKMSSRDFENYMTLFKAMIPHIQAPDLLIYLRADLPKLLEQIKKRGRGYENAIQPDYLEGLNRHYEDWVANYELGNLLVIDVNDLDYTKRPEDFQFILNQVKTELNQKIKVV